MNSMKMLVSDLGIIDYGSALEIQKSLVEMRLKNTFNDRDILLLLEHPHVITLGRSTSKENLKSQPIPVYQVERGGDATYHGPGQLVGYLIFYLKDHDVRKFVWKIEESVINSLSHFGINAERKENHRGVWVKVDGSIKKIASIGLAVNSWVTYHGFALNVNTDLSYFRLINPCGLPSEALTSMEKIIGEKVDIQRVKDAICVEFAKVFQAEVEKADILSLIKGGISSQK